MEQNFDEGYFTIYEDGEFFSAEAGEIDDKIIELLETELPNLYPPSEEDEEDLYPEDMWEISYPLTRVIGYYLENTTMRDVDQTINILEESKTSLVIGGMKKAEIEKFQDRLEIIRNKLKNKGQSTSQHPFAIKSKTALIYELTMALVQAFPSISQSKAVRFVVILLIELGIEPDRRVGKYKLKVSKGDPVVTRFERRYCRFKKKYGTPETMYSKFNKLTKNKH